MRKKTVLRIVYIVLIAACMAMIFYFSAQPATESSSISESFTAKILRAFVSKFNNMSPEEQAELVESLQFAVRKTAHTMVYALLGFLSCGLFNTFEYKKVFLKPIFAFLLVFLYAVSDELHQTVVEGRSGEVRDVLIDSGGAIIGIALFALIAFIAARIRKRRKKV